MVIRFTATQVLDALSAVVKGNENYRDPRAGTSTACQYIIDGEPSCIVGRVLALLGVPNKVLAEMDGCGNPMFAVDGVLALAEHGYEFEKEAEAMLDTAQQRQDRARTWQEAYMAAEALYPR